MKSKISFFNAGLFKSTLRRFWPLWFVHFGGWFLFMPMLTLFNGIGQNRTSDFVLDITRQAVFASPIVSCLMAIISAMAVFSFMYNSRSTGLIASLPLRRETVFGSVWLGGAAPVICSNIVIALLTFVFSLGAVSDTAFAFEAVMSWLGAYSMQFLLFYGIAAITAVMTGSIVVLPVLFFIFNFFAVGMECIVRAHFSLLICGMESYAFDCVLDFLSPVVYMLGNFELENVYDYDQLNDLSHLVSVSYTHWTATVIYCAAGLLFSAAALLIYRKRRMESAGDVVAVRCLRPVFKYGVAVCSALCGGLLLYTLLYAIFNTPSLSVVIMIPSLIIFALVGYFGAKMLLEKSFHVFRDGWAGFIVVCCLCVVFTLGCDLDVFGIGRYVPDEDSIECISYTTTGNGGEVRSREGISEFRALHESIIKDMDRYKSLDLNYENSEYISFRYTLKSGQLITRQYDILTGDENYEKYYELLNSPSILLERFTPTIPVDTEHCMYSVFFTGSEIGEFPLTPEQAVDFYDNALIPDVKAGRYITGSGPYYLATITLELADDDAKPGYPNYTSLTCEINTGCTSCISWVKDELGIDLLNPSGAIDGAANTVAVN